MSRAADRDLIERPEDWYADPQIGRICPYCGHDHCVCSDERLDLAADDALFDGPAEVDR